MNRTAYKAILAFSTLTLLSLPLASATNVDDTNSAGAADALPAVRFASAWTTAVSDAAHGSS